MSAEVISAIGVVLAALVSAVFGYFMKKSADKTAREVAELQARTGVETTSTQAAAEVESQRMEIESEAFTRAKSFYVDVIDRQEVEAREDRAEIDRLRRVINRLVGLLRDRDDMIRSLNPAYNPGPLDPFSDSHGD